MQGTEQQGDGVQGMEEWGDVGPQGWRNGVWGTPEMQGMEQYSMRDPQGWSKAVMGDPRDAGDRATG